MNALAIAGTLGIIGLLLFAAYYWWEQKKKACIHLQQLAREQQGQLIGKIGFFRPMPVVRTSEGGINCQIAGSPTPGKIATINFTIDWPRNDFKMSLTPETLATNLKKLILFKEDAHTGSLGFDETWYIKTNQAERIPLVLNEDARAIVTNMHKSSLVHDLEPEEGEIAELVTGLQQITVAGNSMVVTLTSRVTRTWLSNQLALVRSLLFAMAPAEISYQKHRPVTENELAIAASNLENLLAADCLVCGDPIDDDYLACAKCYAPHHRDCWQYIGKCSIFACGCNKSRPTRR